MYTAMIRMVGDTFTYCRQNTPGAVFWEAGDTLGNMEPCYFFQRHEIDEMIVDMKRDMTVGQQRLFEEGDWELFLTEYKPQLPLVYTKEDHDGKLKAIRRAALLAKMSAEDRALFE